MKDEIKDRLPEKIIDILPLSYGILIYDINMDKNSVIELQDYVTNLQNRIDKAIEKLYCYGEIFDGKILQQFQKEMLEILQGKSDE